MKILYYKIDKSIDHLIREYGISRVAKQIGVSVSFISQALRGETGVSEENYNKIREILTHRRGR